MVEDSERRLAPLSVRVPPSIKRELTQLAKADRRSLALYIQMVLEDHIAAKKAEGKPAGKRK
jgi:predicted transcriptional regulator